VLVWAFDALLGARPSLRLEPVRIDRAQRTWTEA